MLTVVLLMLNADSGHMCCWSDKMVLKGCSAPRQNVYIAQGKHKQQAQAVSAMNVKAAGVSVLAPLLAILS